MQFSYKVFLFPKPANQEAGADLAVEFVRYDQNNPEEMARINHAVALIRPPATTLARPAIGLTCRPIIISSLRDDGSSAPGYHPARSSASSELPKTSSRIIRSVASFRYSCNAFSI